MSKIHDLLTGIHQYHPHSGVTTLQGCRSDVQWWKGFLEGHFKGCLSMECLLDGDVVYGFFVDLSL